MGKSIKPRLTVIGRKNNQRIIAHFLDSEEQKAQETYQTLDTGAIFRRAGKKWELEWGVMPDRKDLTTALLPYYEEQKDIARQYFDKIWKYDEQNDRAYERGEPARTATEWHELWGETDSAFGFYYENGFWMMTNAEDSQHIEIKKGQVYEIEPLSTL